MLARASEDAAACLCQLLALESPTRGPAVAALGRSGGQKLFVPLLSSESSVQRVHGLRLLALTSDSGSDTLLGPVLRATLSRDPVPTAMRLALEELLCGGVSWSNIEQACATGAPPAIVVPSVAQVLLSNSLRNPEDGAASIELLRALTTVPANCDALLSVDGFFPLLLSLVRQADPRQPSSSPRLSPASIAEEEGDVSDGLSREVLRRLFDRALVACRDFRRLLPTVVQSLIRGGDAARYCLRIPSNPVDHLVYGRWEIFLCELLAEGLADASRSLQNGTSPARKSRGSLRDGEGNGGGGGATGAGTDANPCGSPHERMHLLVRAQEAGEAGFKCPASPRSRPASRFARSPRSRFLSLTVPLPSLPPPPLSALSARSSLPLAHRAPSLFLSRPCSFPRLGRRLDGGLALGL